jgi:hypothetical protein
VGEAGFRGGFVRDRGQQQLLVALAALDEAEVGRGR